MKKRIYAVLIGLVLLLGLVSGVASAQCPASEKNIVETAVENGNFTSLVAAVQAANLTNTLSGPGPFTVFAPTDAAFAKLSPTLVKNLLTNDTATLKKILTFHVVPGQFMSTDLRNGMKLMTVEGSELTITVNQSGVFVNNVKVVLSDVKASNGVIHVIDTVLIPPTVSLPSMQCPAKPVSSMNIVETATANGNFTKLVAALQAAGLVEALSGPGPFTVFAPTDAAFAKLDPCFLNGLLTNDIPTLKKILTFHVVPGCFPSTALSNGQSLQTLEGERLMVTIGSSGVFVDNARVVVTDIQTSNGIIHVIDTVLVPPSLA